MNYLPVEVLRNVFSFVPQDELMTTIPRVCRRWKDVATDPGLFRTVDLVNDDLDTGTSIRLLSAARWLTSLKLSGRTDTDVLIQHIGVNHPRLVKLVIDKCRGSRSKKEVSAMQLLYLVRRCTTLQQFSLLETNCKSKRLPVEIGVNLPDLRVIEICGFQKFDSNAFLVSITNHCNRIEKIQVRYYCPMNTSISENVAANFCDKFKESLTCVKFNYNFTWTNMSLASLSRCRKIKELNLYELNNVTDEGIMTLCQMPELESLDFLGVTHITSMGWVRLFGNTSMNSLVKLSLIRIRNLDDPVAAAISLLTNLTDLEIFRGEMTDVGLLSIGNILNLASLKMYYNSSITSHGWKRFSEIINVQEKMTHLDLISCDNRNREVAKVIAKNLRNLQQLKLR